jgi:hypothetical protein
VSTVDATPELDACRDYVLSIPLSAARFLDVFPPIGTSGTACIGRSLDLFGNVVMDEDQGCAVAPGGPSWWSLLGSRECA